MSSNIEALVYYNKETSLILDKLPNYHYHLQVLNGRTYLLAQDDQFYSGYVIREDVDDLPGRILNVDGTDKLYNNLVELSSFNMSVLNKDTVLKGYHYACLTDISKGSYSFSSGNIIYIDPTKCKSGIRSYGYYEYLYSLYPSIKVNDKSLLSLVLKESKETSLINWKSRKDIYK